MNIGLWAQVAILIIDCYIGLFGTGFIQVLYLGRAPCTKETLPDFREKCRVTRHLRVFSWLTGSQRTHGIGASQSLFTCLSQIKIKSFNGPIRLVFHFYRQMTSISINKPIKRHTKNGLKSSTVSPKSVG